MDTRNRRIDEEGEWEYECARCHEWKSKKGMGGCITHTDGFGNCLMCLSCRQALVQYRIKADEKIYAKQILKDIGFYDYPDSDAWYKAMREKYGV
jgi:hypothetical protein